MPGCEVVGVEAAVGPRSGFGRVDHHVAAGQQLVQSFAIVVAAQVERHPPFAEVAQLEEEGAIIDFVSGVDLLVHDAQFTAERLATRQGFGHSSIEQAIATAVSAGVGKLYLTHHHPSHGDAFLQLYLKRLIRKLTSEGVSLPPISYAFEGAPIEF